MVIDMLIRLGNRRKLTFIAFIFSFVFLVVLVTIVSFGQLSFPARLAYADNPLTGYWKLDNNGDDSSGRNHPLTITGATFSTDHAPTDFANTHSLEFSGMGDIAKAGDQPELQPEDSLTFSLWVNSAAYPADSTYQAIASYTKPGAMAGYYFDWDKDNLHFTIGTGATWEQIEVASSNILPNNWSHLLGTYDGSSLKFYINGNLVGSREYSGQIDYPDNSEFCLGCYTGQENQNNFIGKIDDVRVYGRVLDESEISDLGSREFVCGDSANGLVTFTYSGNPITYGSILREDRCWLDRNLGASRVATGVGDSLAYGDYFQWGRGGDGHQSKDSGTTATVSAAENPGHNKFITPASAPYNWHASVNNDFWQGVGGTNNPCPTGWRLPTESEWETEFESWEYGYGPQEAFSVLKLTLNGRRRYFNGSFEDINQYGFYWSSGVEVTMGRNLLVQVLPNVINGFRADGLAVRCIKDLPPNNPPNAPSNFGPSHSIDGSWTTNGQPTLTFNISDPDSSDQVRYQIQIASSEDFEVDYTSGLLDQGETSFTVGQEPGSEGSYAPGKGDTGQSLSDGVYHWRVKVIDQYNAESEWVLAREEDRAFGIYSVPDWTECGDPVTFIYNDEPVTYGSVNGADGRCWLDRNLGASRVATGVGDSLAYGGLFQ